MRVPFLLFRVVVLTGLLFTPLLRPSQAQESTPCAPDDQLHRVSLNMDGDVPNGSSWRPDISGDGRYVVFESEASDLVPNDTNGVADIFLYDRHTCKTTLITVAHDGKGADGTSRSPDISNDGRWIAYDSEATNLVPNDQNPNPNIFVYDRDTHQTELISTTLDGRQAVGISPKISADGQRVLFTSFSNELVPTDHDVCHIFSVDDWATPDTRPLPCPDVLLKDRRSGELIHVSLAENQIDEGENSTEPEYSLSDNGRYAVFATSQSLVSADTNYNVDIYIRDIDTGKLTLIPVGDEFHRAFYPLISADGQTVIFAFWGGVPERPDTNGEIIAYDVPTGRFSVVMPTEQTNMPAMPTNLSISTDGRFVGYIGTVSQFSALAYLHDRTYNVTRTLTLRYVNEHISLLAYDIDLTADARLAVFNTQIQGMGIFTIEVAPIRPPPPDMTFVDENQTLLTVTLEESGPVLTASLEANPPGQNQQWLMGDWDGDGVDTPGAYSDEGVFYWINSMDGMDNPANWSALWIGLKDRQPLAGRFDNPPNDCIGVMDWAEFPPDGKGFALYYTCDLSTSGVAPRLVVKWYSVILPDAGGYSGSFQFATGDWNDDGYDGIAFRRGTTIVFTDESPYPYGPVGVQGGFEHAQYFGAPDSHDEGWLVVGDWDGDTFPSFGLYYQNGVLYTRNDRDWNSGDYTRIELPIEGNVTPMNR